MMFRSLSSLLALALFLFPPITAAADDWPRWRGPENTGWVPAGVSVPATLPADPRLLWQVKLGEGVGSPVVARGRVFCLDNRHDKETLLACDLASGKELWNVLLDDVIGDNTGTGPRGTPVADGPQVFAQSCRGEFQCLDAADGKLLWRVNFVKDFDAVFIGEKGSARAPPATATLVRRWSTARESSSAWADNMVPALSASTRPTARCFGSRKTTYPVTQAPSSPHWPAQNRFYRSLPTALSGLIPVAASCSGGRR